MMPRKNPADHKRGWEQVLETSLLKRRVAARQVRDTRLHPMSTRLPSPPSFCLQLVLRSRDVYATVNPHHAALLNNSTHKQLVFIAPYAARREPSTLAMGLSTIEAVV